MHYIFHSALEEFILIQAKAHTVVLEDFADTFKINEDQVFVAAKHQDIANDCPVAGNHFLVAKEDFIHVRNTDNFPI